MPFSSARQIPVNVTTAPISLRPAVSFFTSPATSIGSRCRRMIAVIARRASAAGHRREECDLPGTGDARIGANVIAVDGGADHLRIFERVGVLLAPAGEPRHQFA